MIVPTTFVWDRECGYVRTTYVCDRECGYVRTTFVWEKESEGMYLLPRYVWERVRVFTYYLPRYVWVCERERESGQNWKPSSYNLWLGWCIDFLQWLGRYYLPTYRPIYIEKTSLIKSLSKERKKCEFGQLRWQFFGHLRPPSSEILERVKCDQILAKVAKF